MYQILHNLERYVERMGSTQWLVVILVVICLGILCMRGMGRANY